MNETADLRHVFLHSERIAFSALLKMLGDTGNRVRLQKSFIDHGFDHGRQGVSPLVLTKPDDSSGELFCILHGRL